MGNLIFPTVFKKLRGREREREGRKDRKRERERERERERQRFVDLFQLGRKMDILFEEKILLIKKPHFSSQNPCFCF